MIDKNFTTFERQVEILKQRNMIFGSEETAIRYLIRYGYYNIVNGYKDPFVYIENGKEYYKNGTTFEHLFDLYYLDRNIRSVIMNSMLEVEDNLRTALGHTLAESFTADQTKYLNRTNFRLGNWRAKDNEYQLDGLMRKFNNILSDNSQPFKHYREDYHNIPPWVLLKGASFGNIVNFIKLQKGPQKDRIISLIYGIPATLVRDQEIRELFMDTIFMCHDYRNCAAHGGRIYNHSTKASFRYNVLLHKKHSIKEADYRSGIWRTEIPALCASLYYLDNLRPVITLRSGIAYYYNEYLKKYPEDKNYLDRYLKMPAHEEY